MMPTPDMAMAFRKITRHCSERIAESAFELAMRRRAKVTAVHKANVLPRVRRPVPGVPSAPSPPEYPGRRL